MILDNSPLFVGDYVYDVAYGAGRVVGVDTGLVVAFPSGLQQGYFDGGLSKTFNRRTLYWADPTAGRLPPLKDAKKRVIMDDATANLAMTIDRIMKAQPNG